MNNNININRQPLTQNDIGDGKYFDALLKKYNTITISIPFYKTKFFLSSIIGTSLVVLFTGIYYFSYQVSTRANKQAVKYNTLSKIDSDITQKTDGVNFHQLSKIIGKDSNSTTISGDSTRIRLVKQIDITRFFKNPSDQIQLFNDSLAIYCNSLHSELSIINLNTHKTISRFIPNDTSLINHLITISPVAKNIIDSNLRYFQRKDRQLPINPLNISTYFYDGKYIWVGASLDLIEPEVDFSGQSFDLMRHFFIFKFDNSLKKIIKIYALPSHSRFAFWPTIYNFSMLDSNTVYLDVSSQNKDTLLASYSLNNINNQLTLRKAYRIKYPPELPEKDENGNPAQYGICVENGFDNQDIYVFSKGLDIFKINDSNQVNLSPQLFNWSKTDSINTVLAYHTLKSKLQAFVVLYNNNTIISEPGDFLMGKVNLNRKLYYCFVDKNYSPIENKPIVFTNNGFLVSELPDGTIQLITEDNGEYTLKIYKIF